MNEELEEGLTVVLFVTSCLSLSLPFLVFLTVQSSVQNACVDQEEWSKEVMSRHFERTDSGAQSVVDVSRSHSE